MKVSIVAALSLDGRIAQSGTQNSLEWTSKEDKQFFVEKTKESGAMIMGRTTFETIGKSLPGRLIVVMTRDKTGLESIEGTLEFTTAKPNSILNDLEMRGFKEVIIAGGSNIYSLFLKEKCVTDLYLTLEPFIFGEGVLFVESCDMTTLKLIETRKLGEQSVLLHYSVI